MDANQFLNSLSLIQITTFVLVVFGVIMLLYSIYTVTKFMNVLKVNEYDNSQWILIIVLIFFFVVGYSIHALDVFNVFSFPVDPALMVSLIYFFGAVFVVRSMLSIKKMVKTILGEIISDEKAYSIFTNRLGADSSDLVHLKDVFHIDCEHCKKKVSYTIADVVRQNSNMGDKGVNVQTTFGIRSIILRPTHKCISGRREIITIHDNDLAYRSIDKSRMILGDTI